MPTHSEVIQQLLDERDQLREVIRLARPFLLHYLAPVAERKDGISRLRSEVDRLVRSWPEPDADLYKVYYDPCQECDLSGSDECQGHFSIDKDAESPESSDDEDVTHHESLDLCLFFLTQAAMLADGLTIGPSPRSNMASVFMNKNLSPGDLVLEQTTVGDKEHDRRRIGWLVKQGREPIHTDKEWKQALVDGVCCALEDERPTEQIYYIRTLTGETVRWHNARFIRLPANSYETLYALYGKAFFASARRCSDCDTTSYVPSNVRWSQFDPDTGCRNCHGQVGRLSEDELRELTDA